MTTLTSACDTSESPFLSLASQLESIHVTLPIQLYILPCEVMADALSRILNSSIELELDSK